MNLKSRLAALEARRQPSGAVRIFIMPAGQSEDAITGFYIAGDTATLREPNETLEALQERAEKAIPDTRATAIFRPICTTTHEAHHYD